MMMSLKEKNPLKWLTEGVRTPLGGEEERTGLAVEGEILQRSRILKGINIPGQGEEETGCRKGTSGGVFLQRVGNRQKYR